MSFDIFDVVFPDPLSYVTQADVIGWLTCITISLVIFIGLFLFANSVNDEPLIQKRFLFPWAIGLGILLFGVLVYSKAVAGMMFADPIVTNVDEVKSAIQQEYGIELTDESIQALYSASGNRYREHQYVADVHGQVHPYAIVGNSFYFIDESSR